jgi:hypothetical protein
MGGRHRMALSTMGRITRHRWHRCKRRHKSYRTLAKCIWHRALIIRGEGSYAVIGRGRPLVISLWENLALARYALQRMEGGGRIEQLVPPREAQGIE